MIVLLVSETISTNIPSTALRQPLCFLPRSTSRNFFGKKNCCAVPSLTLTVHLSAKSTLFSSNTTCTGPVGKIIAAATCASSCTYSLSVIVNAPEPVFAFLVGLSAEGAVAVRGEPAFWMGASRLLVQAVALESTRVDAFDAGGFLHVCSLGVTVGTWVITLQEQLDWVACAIWSYCWAMALFVSAVGQLEVSVSVSICRPLYALFMPCHEY